METKIIKEKKPTKRGISISIGSANPINGQTWEEAIWLAGYNYAKKQLTKTKKK